ncbi:MAG: hypothetical protein HQL97_10935 [Magnetococcales bacterium]|nr:hypothetical protein [Magnetococcales bacterium]
MNRGVMMESEIVLHFCRSNRALALGQHKLYVQGVVNHLFATFQDVSQDPEYIVEQEYQKLCNTPVWDDSQICGDFDELAELAWDRGVERFQDLMFVKQQMMNLATAGLYHLWERTFKSFLERETNLSGLWLSCLSSKNNQKELKNGEKSSVKSGHRITREEAVRKIRKFRFDEVIEWVKKSNFSKCSEAESILDGLETLCLVANTVKHGNGLSCDNIFKKDNDFFVGSAENKKMFEQIKLSNSDSDRLNESLFYETFNRPDADDLWVTEELFQDFACVVERFWHTLPERIEIYCGDRL